MELLFVSIIRLLVPLLIFIFPLFGFLLSIGADTIDWYIFPFYNSSDYLFYQTWDKIFDIYFLGIASIVALSWKDKFATKVVLILFFYRLTGVLLAEITGLREFYLLFPNLLPALYLFILLFHRFKKNVKVFESMKDFFLIFLLLSIPKVTAEYYIHYIQRLPWEYEWGKFLPQGPEPATTLLNQIIWLAIFLILPTIAILYKIKINNTKNSKP